jgi:hypothetical protein
MVFPSRDPILTPVAVATVEATGEKREITKEEFTPTKESVSKIFSLASDSTAVTAIYFSRFLVF